MDEQCVMMVRERERERGESLMRRMRERGESLICFEKRKD